MVEWFKAAVLKTAEGQLSEGSNPSFSAIFFALFQAVDKIRTYNRQLRTCNRRLRTMDKMSDGNQQKN